jgi:hypothetical protein
MDLKSAKELDYVLSFFKDGQEYHSVVIKDAEKKEKKLKHDYRIYLKHLVDIGFLKVNPNNEWKYRIEFDGIVFKGFEKQYKEDNRLITREVKMNLFSGFLGAIFGAILGGLIPLIVQQILPDKVKKVELIKPIYLNKNIPLEEKEKKEHLMLNSNTDTLIVKTIILKQKCINK